MTACWLAVVVHPGEFALGTAAGDWTLDLTGWSPGRSALLPTSPIIAVVVGWRLGVNTALSFWLARILTRPLGANLGDWLALPKADGRLGIDTAGTSVIFPVAILPTVVHLMVSRRDVIDQEQPQRHQFAAPRDPRREWVMLGYFAAVTIAAGLFLEWGPRRGGPTGRRPSVPALPVPAVPASRCLRRGHRRWVLASTSPSAPAGRRHAVRRDPCGPRNDDEAGYDTAVCA